MMQAMMIGAQEPASTIRVLYMEQAGYHFDDVNMLRTVFKTLTGVDVAIDTVRYEEYLEHLLTSGEVYDVCAIDHIWVADLVAEGLLTSLDEYLTPKMRKDLAPGVKEAFLYQKKMWGMPFLLNLQFLFYNEQLLKEAGYTKAPDSLEAMVDQMKAVKGKNLVEYPWTDAWQQGESLVMEFVWLVGAFEGQLFDQDGQPTFDQEAGVKALEFMRMLLNEGLASPTILQNDELAARDDFLAGRAAFTSTWIFLQGLLDKTSGSLIGGAGKMDALPASKFVTAKTSSILSTQGLAIMAGSLRKDVAWKWVQFFTSPLVQRAFVYEMPVWSSVQTSEDALRLDPKMLTKRNQLLSASLRPNIVNYDRVSSILQTYIHVALEGSLEPEEALKKAKGEVLQVLSESQ